MYIVQTPYVNNTTSKYSRIILWISVHWEQTMVVLQIPIWYVMVSNLSFCMHKCLVHVQHLLLRENGCWSSSWAFGFPSVEKTWMRPCFGRGVWRWNMDAPMAKSNFIYMQYPCITLTSSVFFTFSFQVTMKKNQLYMEVQKERIPEISRALRTALLPTLSCHSITAL